MIFEELEKEQSFLFYNTDAVFPALTEEMFELAALLAPEVLPWGEMRRVGDSTFALWHLSRHSPGTRFWGRCSLRHATRAGCSSPLPVCLIAMVPQPHSENLRAV